MPARGHSSAPKFTPNVPRELQHYFQELEMLFAPAQVINNTEKKKHTCHYINRASMKTNYRHMVYERQTVGAQKPNRVVHTSPIQPQLVPQLGLNFDLNSQDLNFPNRKFSRVEVKVEAF
jgi:hypothetical protein